MQADPNAVRNGPILLELRPATMTAGKWLALSPALFVASAALLASALRFVAKAALFWGQVGLVSAGVFVLVLLMALVAGIVTLVLLNERGRIVLTPSQLLYYGLGGRLKRAISRADIGQVVYQPIAAAGMGTTLPFAFLLGKDGSILHETSGRPTSWGGGLPKLWAELGIQPTTNSGLLTLKQMRRLHDLTPGLPPPTFSGTAEDLERRFQRAQSRLQTATIILAGLGLLAALVPGRWAMVAVLIPMFIVLSTLAVQLIRAWMAYRKEL
jgi:hypothetical protein